MKNIIKIFVLFAAHTIVWHTNAAAQQRDYITVRGWLSDCYGAMERQTGNAGDQRDRVTVQGCVSYFMGMMDYAYLLLATQGKACDREKYNQEQIFSATVEQMRDIPEDEQTNTATAAVLNQEIARICQMK